MIILDGVSKRYRTTHGMGPWILRDVSLTIPSGCNVGLIGRNGAGKSTLLRLIGGMDVPTEGRVERQCSVSWPLGLAGGLQGSLTARQNARFVCRLHGLDQSDEMEKRVEWIKKYSELGDYYDEPVKVYSSGMKARLRFSLSLICKFDMYIVDELTSVGDASFKRKSNRAFKKLARRAGLIMVSHDERALRQYCDAGIWLHNGQVYWFDRLKDALKSYHKSLIEPGQEDALADSTPNELSAD